MQQRFLGRSGLQLSQLSLGTLTWGTELDIDTCQGLLSEYLDAGGTTLDTAAGFGNGASEATLGELLPGGVPREELVIISKSSMRNSGYADGSRAGMLRSLDTSLERLGLDYLDLWLLPAWDSHTAWEETLSAWELAVSSGRVRYVGISNFSGWQSTKAALLSQGLAGSAPLSHSTVVAHELEYSLVNRMAELEQLPAARDAELGVICWAPLGRGVLTGKYRTRTPGDSRAASETFAGYVAPYLDARAQGVIEAVATAAQGLGRDFADVALSWVLGKNSVTSTVVGARNVQQLQEILNSSLEPLPEQITTVLDEISAPTGLL